MTTTIAIAEALSRIREHADRQNTHIVYTEQMSRSDRELL